jgi:DNA-directed RNA polymerase subunit RPC12/RpoP
MNQPPRPQLEELDDDDEETVECQDCGTIVNKSDCLKTDGGTYVCKYCREDFNSLVETLEENEDIVECKECFELFPKEACTKIAIGYICPECGKIHSHEESEFEIDSIPDVVIADEDTFKIDFPELERIEYGNDMIPDESTPEVGPNPEPMAEPECVGPECEAPVEAPVTKEETITKLVVDEHEAIDGYEKAKIEIEANSELDEKEKEEILDTIEHIKEEEVEHIEELEGLVDKVEETKADEESESEDESEVLVEGSGFLGKVILDDYFKKDGQRNPENKNGTGY